MMKKIFSALVTGALALGVAAICHFGTMPVSAEAYTYEPITGLTEGDYYEGAIFYWIEAPDSEDIYDGSIPTMTGLGYTVSMESNPKNGASGMPVVSDASFPGPATYQGSQNDPGMTQSVIDDSNITFTKPGEYVWKLTPKEVTYPAGITPSDVVNYAYPANVYLHAVVTDNNGELEVYTVYLSRRSSSASQESYKFANSIFEYDTDTLTVSKNVTGNAGDKSAQFTFRVDLTGCNPGTVIDGVEVSADGTWTKNYGLTHGDSFSIEGIPDGAGYTITETNADDYTTSIAQDCNGYDHYWGPGEGRNLFQRIACQGMAYQSNGITFIQQRNGTVSINGEATNEVFSYPGDALSIPPKQMTVLAPGTYTVSAYEAMLSFQAISLSSDQPEIILSTDIPDGDFYTFTVDEPVTVLIRVHVLPEDGDYGINIANAKAAIVAGDIPLDNWEPYSNLEGDVSNPGVK